MENVYEIILTSASGRIFLLLGTMRKGMLSLNKNKSSFLNSLILNISNIAVTELQTS